MTDPIPASAHGLRRVFRESIVARDLAEPLASFDATSIVDDVREFLVNRPLTVLGIRVDGILAGFLHQGRLDDRPIAQQMHPIAEAAVVATTTPVQEVVTLLNQHSFVFVATLGQPVGIIERHDLEKPPMRMWLFGMITLFEMSLTRVIDQTYPNDSWVCEMSEARADKAKQLQAERARRNETVRLIDCLQLSDKGQVFAKSDELRKRFWDRSKNQIRGVIKDLESLRNNLAHAQPYAATNWDAVLRLSETLDRLLEISPDYVLMNSLQPFPDGAPEC
ncbi:CBS domain-containing protein [Roseiconus lacunae]|uniref:CBS domain-containing protein n=1 Tax=Roseiconus lacunae TaxID=2605694 RepID=A0ABT7PFE5_9BACT|nr:hypothetical protein [Roseiconus lacunae]MCD0462774.1 hypothetical protein [Roseiconus lacunae]MDM4015219.1 hypothetical protein [Roseiconus lacunae]WRQ50104.1 hypothetical protein U8335_24500 [Stieleria sp. HD01]